MAIMALANNVLVHIEILNSIFFPSQENRFCVDKVIFKIIKYLVTEQKRLMIFFQERPIKSVTWPEKIPDLNQFIEYF